MKIECLICGKEYVLVRIKQLTKTQTSTILTHECKLYEVMYLQKKITSIEVFE